MCCGSVAFFIQMSNPSIVFDQWLADGAVRLAFGYIIGKEKMTTDSTVERVKFHDDCII